MSDKKVKKNTLLGHVKAKALLREKSIQDVAFREIQEKLSEVECDVTDLAGKLDTSLLLFIAECIENLKDVKLTGEQKEALALRVLNSYCPMDENKYAKAREQLAFLCAQKLVKKVASSRVVWKFAKTYLLKCIGV